MSLENELNTIAVHLGRIALALEKFVDAPATQAPATSAHAPTVVQAGPPATGPVGGPPVGVPPTTGPAMAAPGAGVPSSSPPVAAGAPGPTAPAMSAPAPTQTPQIPVQGVPTLDDIKALANDFHRAHPERTAEFVQVLAAKNAQKISELPPDSYLEIHGKLKEMMGGA